jgi:hypothetical protein
VLSIRLLLLLMLPLLLLSLLPSRTIGVQLFASFQPLPTKKSNGSGMYGAVRASTYLSFASVCPPVSHSLDA